MRHPHGLRAASAAAAVSPYGVPLGGGFYAGDISHTANGVATHKLIVAPYANVILTSWKTSNTLSGGASSTFNGAANSAALNNADHPAAQYCETVTIGGFSDWYLPALYELDIAYQNLKPTTDANSTSAGINPYAVPPRASNRTAGVPGRTSAAAFQSGGAEAFLATNHWTSTEINETISYQMPFQNGFFGTGTKISMLVVRPFRKVAV
jgi:hypothetical protein